MASCTSASVKDACANRIVGYATGPRMTARLAVAALQLAIVRRCPTGTVVVHSDRGSQFRSRAYLSTLHDAGLTGSMGRVGAAGDNAAMESFFALLQTNVLDRRVWATRDELRARSSAGSNGPTIAGDASVGSAS